VLLERSGRLELSCRPHEVPFDRPHVEADTGSDLAGGLACGEQEDDLLLGWRQLWDGHDTPFLTEPVQRCDDP
jgi:hypothetical protein